MSSSLLDCYYTPLPAPASCWLHGYASADAVPKDAANRMLFWESYAHIVWDAILDAAAYHVVLRDADNQTIDKFTVEQAEFVYTAEQAKKYSYYETMIDGWMPYIKARALRVFSVTVGAVDAVGNVAYGAPQLFIRPAPQGFSFNTFSDGHSIFIDTWEVVGRDDDGIIVWLNSNLSSIASTVAINGVNKTQYDYGMAIVNSNSKRLRIPHDYSSTQLSAVIYDAWTNAETLKGNLDTYPYDYIEPCAPINIPAVTRFSKYSVSPPQAVWVIQHNTNSYPPVRTLDSAGTQVFGAIVYNDSNTITITFSAPFSGTVYL